MLKHTQHTAYIRYSRHLQTILTPCSFRKPWLQVPVCCFHQLLSETFHIQIQCKCFYVKDLEERKAADAEDATENEVSDPEEDDLTDSQQTNKLSELYSTTIPSVDSAMESWDGSGLDAGYGSQGKLAKIFSCSLFF